MRFFISCNRDIVVLDKGLESAVDLTVFTDHELIERRTGMIRIDPGSPDVIQFPDGSYVFPRMDGSTAVIEPRSDGARGYELIFYSDEAQASFVEEMGSIPYAQQAAGVA